MDQPNAMFLLQENHLNTKTNHGITKCAQTHRAYVTAKPSPVFIFCLLITYTCFHFADSSLAWISRAEKDIRALEAKYLQ